MRASLKQAAWMHARARFSPLAGPRVPGVAHRNSRAGKYRSRPPSPPLAGARWADGTRLQPPRRASVGCLVRRRYRYALPLLPAPAGAGTGTAGPWHAICAGAWLNPGPLSFLSSSSPVADGNAGKGPDRPGTRHQDLHAPGTAPGRLASLGHSPSSGTTASLADPTALGCIGPGPGCRARAGLGWVGLGRVPKRPSARRAPPHLFPPQEVVRWRALAWPGRRRSRPGTERRRQSGCGKGAAEALPRSRQLAAGVTRQGGRGLRSEAEAVAFPAWHHDCQGHAVHVARPGRAQPSGTPYPRQGRTGLDRREPARGGRGLGLGSWGMAGRGWTGRGLGRPRAVKLLSSQPRLRRLTRGVLRGTLLRRAHAGCGAGAVPDKLVNAPGQGPHGALGTRA